ncbi:MAG: sensor histidine kinase, partial [Thermanaeromonas sp.]|uniref:sensor histidine kinase n=1 Tax=Thermanaeromonas sp. TaxID=2003697 RepID=UPI00243C4B5A
EQAEKKARLRLAEVSQDFHRYTEQDIKRAYEEAYNLQVELIRLREKEKLLNFRRNHLEMSLRRLKLTVEKAEKLVHQVGVVLKFLTGELQDLTSKIGELEQTYHLALSIIRAQEEERRRVAREIHDGPAQSLANIVMRAEYCLKLLDRDPGKVREELQALQNIVLTSLQDIRKIIFDLRPMVLDDLGLVPALKRYFSAYAEQYGLEVDFLCFGQQRRLDSAVEIALFRIIQEAVNNIKKHAKVKSAVVKMEMLPDKVTVVIRDEGQGFDLEAVQNRKEGGGFGLLGMKERVQLLKGQLKIITAPGRGTTVSVTIPLQSGESQ